ncbi:MAG: peroxiredoxin [Longispora sp.]|nr:peroxiredoxin [Longispora sp. (in: high G+C Gram-positive bacteria)]
MAQVGTRAPDFTLRDQNNQKVTLADYVGRKHVLLVFYPLAFTGICQSELAEIKENLPLYQIDDVAVLTISVDSVYSHKVWADREGFEFPLLADFWPHGGVAKAFGVFNEGKGTAFRGTFVIDKTGLIRYAELSESGQARDQGAWRKVLETLVG